MLARLFMLGAAWTAMILVPGGFVAGLLYKTSLKPRYLAWRRQRQAQLNAKTLMQLESIMSRVTKKSCKRPTG